MPHHSVLSEVLSQVLPKGCSKVLSEIYLHPLSHVSVEQLTHRWRRYCCLALLVATGCTAPTDDLQKTEDKVDLLITGASIVIASENRVTSPKDIAISDGVIVAITDTISITGTGSEAASEPTMRAEQVVNAEGLYVIPGLIDAHAHIGDGGMQEQTEADRIQALEQFLSYGVTTIFVPGGGGGNDDQLRQWKSRCSSGELRCPRLLGSGALITAPGSHPISTIWGFPPDADPAVVYERGAVSISETEPVEPLLDHKKSLGADAIKIIIEDQLGPDPPTPRLSNTKIAQLTSASHQRGLKVFAHVSLAEHVADGVANGVDAIMHSADDPIAAETLAAMAQERVFYVPTLSLFEGLFARGEGHYEAEPFAQLGVSNQALESLNGPGFAFGGPAQSEAELEEWKRALNSNIMRATAAGVPLALGTDTNNPTVFPGYSAHRELALLVEAGLTAAQALTTASLSSAEMLGLSSQVGQVEAGFGADLLLLRNNPLDDILNTRSLQAVISQGRMMEPVEQ